MLSFRTRLHPRSPRPSSLSPSERNDSCLMCRFARKTCPCNYNDLGECVRCSRLGLPCFGRGARRPSWFKDQDDETCIQRSQLRDATRSWNRHRYNSAGTCRLCLCHLDIISPWFPNRCLSLECTQPSPAPLPTPTISLSSYAYDTAYLSSLRIGGGAFLRSPFSPYRHSNSSSTAMLDSSSSPALSVTSFSTFSSASYHHCSPSNDGSILLTPGASSSSFSPPPTHSTLGSSSNLEPNGLPLPIDPANSLSLEQTNEYTSSSWSHVPVVFVDPPEPGPSDFASYLYLGPFF